MSTIANGNHKMPPALTVPQHTTMSFLRLLALAVPLQELFDEPLLHPQALPEKSQTEVVVGIGDALDLLSRSLATMSTGIDIKSFPFNVDKVNENLAKLGVSPLGQEEANAQHIAAT